MGNSVSLLKYALLIVLFCTSRVREKDLYEPLGKDPDDTEELDLSFKFPLRTNEQIDVTVTSADEKVAEGILIGIYSQQPYEKNETVITKPLYVGCTDVDGCTYAIISAPVNVDKVYITSLTAGSPGMQEVDVQLGVTCVLSAVLFQVSISASTRMAVARGGAELAILVSRKLSNFYELYSPYVDTEVGKDGILLLNASPLVPKEELSPKFLNRVSSWYPEQKSVQDVDLNKSSDLVVTGELGAEVWATYVDDGGSYANNRTVYNVLTYYSYKEGEPNKCENIQGHRMTLLLPNIHQEKYPSGLKVQSLYWDGNRYDTIFSKGTRIGFAVARGGLSMTNVATGGVSSKSAYKFQNQAFPNASVDGFYYPTPTLNTTKETNAMIRSMSDYNCCIMGFDICPYGDVKADYDFNDMPIRLTAPPIFVVELEEDIPVIDEFAPSEAICGTLIFEDQWPKMGDYDFNDLVVNYAHELERGDDSSITAVKLTFIPIAKGAAPWTYIGVGIELPLPENIIDRSRLEGTIIEEGNEWATFIVWNDVNVVLGTAEGHVNTEGMATEIPGTPAEITVWLKTPVSNLQTRRFNPFISVNSRQEEIHLVDYKPIKHADVSFLRTENDRPDPEPGAYHRMDNRYSWALDFPRKEASSPAWEYPKEGINITQACPSYEKRVLDQSNLSWFDASVSGNVNRELLY